MKKILGLLLLLTIILSACQTPPDDIAADRPALLYYEQDYDSIDGGRGIINSNGELILPIDSTNKVIIKDADGKPVYIMTKLTSYDYTRYDQWGHLPVGAEFQFFDINGKLLQTVDMSDMGQVVCYYSAADLQDTLFSCDMIDSGGGIIVKHIDGTTLLDQQFDFPDHYQIQDHYTSLTVADDWFALEYSFYGNRGNPYNTYELLDEGTDFYTTAGEPMIMPQAYRRVWPLYDDEDLKETGYFRAEYTTADGDTMLDILDGKGSVVLSGFGSIYGYHDGVLIGEQNGESGMMDMQGNWLYRESTGQTIPSPDTAEVPYMIHYYNDSISGIINTNGTLIVPPDNVTGKSIQYDADGEQAYAMAVLNIYDYTKRDYWGKPVVSGAEFKFYSPYGELLQTVDMRGKGQVHFYEGATLQDSVFLCDMADINGTLAVLRMDGTVITSIDLGIPEGKVINSRSRWLTLADDWLYLSYGYNKDYEDLADGRCFCTLTGEPLTLPQDYSIIEPLYDSDGSGRLNAEYLEANYINSQGKYLTDILDGQGRVVLSGLSYYSTCYDGLLVCERGNERGLMDLRNGSWLYRETVFDTLDD